MSIDYRNDCALPVDGADLVSLAAFVMDSMLLDPQAELSITCVEPADIAVLHEEYLDEPGPTDVMSFPMDELRPGTADERTAGVLGDVVLCPSVAASQAAAAGHGTDHELRILLTHGILHLLGYDHAEPDEEREMFALQKALLERWRSHRRGGGQA